jgi:hypothetical protein
MTADPESSHVPLRQWGGSFGISNLSATASVNCRKSSSDIAKAMVGDTRLMNRGCQSADQIVNSFVFCGEHDHCTLRNAVRTRDVSSTQDSVSSTSP